MKVISAILTILPVVLLCSGCEPSADDVRGELEVTPATTTLTGDEKMVILTANVAGNGDAPESIVYPLKWTVSDPTVGHVAVQSANSAVYTQTYSGTHATTTIITVRDGLAREGLATVLWQPTSTNTH